MTVKRNQMFRLNCLETEVGLSGIEAADSAKPMEN
jgi:hypothetical protein